MAAIRLGLSKLLKAPLLALLRRPAVATRLNGWTWTRTLVSGAVINATASGTHARPHRLSLWSPPDGGTAGPGWAQKGFGDFDASAAAVRGHAYVSWPSLVDRRFSARHLPPCEARPLPALDEVVELFMRPAGVPMQRSERNTALLGFFAQWFTDSFLRTHPSDLRRNTSNHEIDFCQIYGLNEDTTHALRAHRGGLLASRDTPTGEFPALLLRDGAVDPAFAGLDYASRGRDGTARMPIEHIMDRAKLRTEEITRRLPWIYATGLERGSSNIGYAAISTLFLREHNRLARAIGQAHPGWSDDRIFEAARNTVIVIGLKIVIEEYIVQLAQSPVKLVMDPALAPRKTWYRTNRIALEFNLLYRWHSMVPDSLPIGGREVPFTELSFNNELLESVGIEPLISTLSAMPAGYIGLHNVPRVLSEAEKAAHLLSRRFALAPMNDYREQFGLERLRSFEALSQDPAHREALRTLYRGDIDAVEFLPGLFAEDDRMDASFGSLLMRMVGYDAFTQALTNPLLAPQVYNPETFSQVGWEAIQTTRSIDDVFQRNLHAVPGHVTAQRALLGLADSLVATPVGPAPAGNTGSPTGTPTAVR